MERPGLRRLMIDIEAGKIDTVVVYKIDRLTRSLPDFAKLVEVFDRNGVSFVAVTQQFNTTTSMGRLTLNILLSFAQFEREVTGERIRDKIAASKAKGMWMGGVPPLGYDVVERKLVINEREAALVRDIFRRYAEHGSAARLVRELEIEGHTTKAWLTQSGRERLGRSIDQQYLFTLLRNRIYLGEICNHETWYSAQHDPIISQELWDAAHAFIERRKQAPREHRAKHPALLAGLLFAPDGQRMLHSFVKKKNGRQYRYYVPYLHKRRNAGASLAPHTPDVGHLPAAEIEDAVLAQIHAALSSPQMLIAVWRSCQQHPAGSTLDEAQVVVAMQRIGDVWSQLFPAEQQRIAVQESSGATGDGQAASLATSSAGGTSLLQARTVNEVVKAQTNKVRLARLKGELVDRPQAIAHVFKLARSERDAWLNWPARISAQMAAKLGVDPHTMHIALEAAVREHLQELGEMRPRVD